MDIKKTLVTASLLSALVGGAVGAGINEPQIIVVAPELDQQQLYIANEVANNRIPNFDTLATKPDELDKAKWDYKIITEYLGDDLTLVQDFCLRNRGADDCNLYKRVKHQIDLQINNQIK